MVLIFGSNVRKKRPLPVAATSQRNWKLFLTGFAEAVLDQALATKLTSCSTISSVPKVFLLAAA